MFKYCQDCQYIVLCNNPVGSKRLAKWSDWTVLHVNIAYLLQSGCQMAFHFIDMRFIVPSIGFLYIDRTQSTLIVDLILKKP